MSSVANLTHTHTKIIIIATVFSLLDQLYQWFIQGKVRYYYYEPQGVTHFFWICKKEDKVSYP